MGNLWNKILDGTTDTQRKVLFLGLDAAGVLYLVNTSDCNKVNNIFVSGKTTVTDLSFIYSKQYNLCTRFFTL